MNLPLNYDKIVYLYSAKSLMEICSDFIIDCVCKEGGFFHLFSILIFFHH